MELSKKLKEIDEAALKTLAPVFADFDRISAENTEKVLRSFAKHRVSDSMFAGSTGYGYTDNGRDALDRIYADVFGAEAAFCRHSIVNGTHAISIALFGLLRPGDIMLSITGRPYDTLSDVIGDRTHDGTGSLADFGVGYDETELCEGGIDYPSVEEKIAKYGEKIEVIFIQRSKGYQTRPTLSVERIGELISFLKEIKIEGRLYFSVNFEATMPITP